MRRLASALLVLALSLPLPVSADWDDGVAAYRRGDWAVAVRELKPLADRGDPRAQARIGRLLLDGHGLPKDEAEAVRLLRQAAGQGDAMGQLGLADVLMAGRGGVAIDVPRAIILLQLAADGGEAEALHRLGLLEVFSAKVGGVSMPQSAARGVDNLARAAQLGWAPSQELLGIVLLNGMAGQAKDPARAVELLRQAADQGSGTAQALYGQALLHGTGGLVVDREAAIGWLRKSADQENLNGLHILGLALVTGDSLPRDVEAGFKLLRRAVDKGDPAAAEALGMMFWRGEQVQKDHAQAVTWLRQAADKGLASAQNEYAFALWNGDGIAQDRTEAVTWLRKAADKGNSAAQFGLGEAYLNGAGVARDVVEAESWYMLAAINASPADNKANCEKKRDQTAALLLPSELIRARDLAAARSGKPSAQFVTNAVPPAMPRPPSALPPASAIPPLPAPFPGGATPGITAGTGFFVNRDGTVLTDSHVVAACHTIRVTPSDAPSSGEATLIARDQVNDLAVLKTHLAPVGVARFREDKPMRPGDGVVAIGYPLSSLLSREANVTVGVISALAGPRGDSRYFQITAPIQKGNSGGPLADMSGNIVGIIESKLNAATIQRVYDDMPQNVSFATKAELMRRFLADNGIAAQGGPAKETLSAADVGERVKQATVLIECLP